MNTADIRRKKVAPETLGRVMRAVIDFVLAGRIATNIDLAEAAGISDTQCWAALSNLQQSGDITIERTGKYRRITILTGEHAGTQTVSEKAKPKPQPKTAAPEPPVMRNIRCEWCGKNIGKSRYGRSYCNLRCARKFDRYGLRSQKEVEAVRNRPPGPPGCTTVEEWLARGGEIYRIEPRPWPVGGVPVRLRGSRIGASRVGAAE